MIAFNIARLSAVAAVAILALLVLGRSMADTHSGYLVDRGVAVYYAVIPAEMIRGHAKQHPEATMHGGAPNRPHVHHVMVALFDAASLDRIVDAEVSATVGEVGLAGRQKKLESFTVAGARTYGNYFDMRSNTNYRVVVEIQTPAAKDAARVEFAFKHELSP